MVNMLWLRYTILVDIVAGTQQLISHGKIGDNMTQSERRQFLIRYLLSENAQYTNIEIPEDEVSQKQLLRALMNVRPAIPANDEFLAVQNAYLQEVNQVRGITNLSDLLPTINHNNGNIFLWRGDITTLRVEGIVNAANSGLTGCWQPCHACIDNCIHTYAGIQLRAACDKIIREQGHEEPTGCAKITPAFNLPCRHVLHTVGPIIMGGLTKKDCDLLASCYTSCLNLAAENDLHSIAFCCISTGVFHFPPEEAARIAYRTVMDWKQKESYFMNVVFNVFSQQDELIYQSVLEKDKS